ncbi:YtxH domain-containing protein [bacterium]|jgi:gas vesicle protein|nr:YtxH domain-containing protein [bacterium]
MKKGMLLIGVVVGIAAGAAVGLYLKDDEIRAKVDESARRIKDLADLIQERVEQNRAKVEETRASETLRNQQWADQQWEALGI